MANKYRGEVEIQLGGKTRKLVFNTNAIAELEGLLGTGTIGMLSELGNESKVDGVQAFRLARALLFVGLREAGARNASLDAVGRRMRPDELAVYLDVCMRGLLAALGMEAKAKPEAEGEGGPDPLAVTAPTTGESSTSGSSESGPSQ